MRRETLDLTKRSHWHKEHSRDNTRANYKVVVIKEIYYPGLYLRIRAVKAAVGEFYV